MVVHERHVAPSILAADLARLEAEVREVMAAGARVIHVDVMDGHFVPPITVGALVVAALRDALPDEAYLDCHLMVERPELQVEEFARAGADGITVHAEATPHVHRVLTAIRDAGCRAGLAVTPSTPLGVFGEVRDALDLALCMTVNPGWGGQRLIPGTLDKVRGLRELVGAPFPVEVDGGVDARSAPACADAGASWFVAGSAIFAADDPAAAFREIGRAVGAAG
ncbi:MAG: ribulose-phosphate 3-epimerase [Actinomycetota bacterium]|nr:ribulose-phosphate 3-epimerase [Actinomycetota bacterium]